MFLCLLLSAFASLSYAADCVQSRDSGYTCDGGSPSFSFYFDSRSKVCQPFSFKGCGGNGNRYSSRAECLSSCVKQSVSSPSPSSVPTSPGSQWLQADRCGSSFLIPNHHYVECVDGVCPSNHSCSVSICCPSRDYVCSLRDDSGSFAEGIDDKPRFSWNGRVNSCERFSYYGANGNYNNFPNFQSCMRYCSNSV